MITSLSSEAKSRLAARCMGSLSDPESRSRAPTTPTLNDLGNCKVTTSPPMEAFFDAPSGGHSCASVVDLQQHLQHLLQTTVTPTKADHISITFELRSNVVFAIPLTEDESASLEAGAGIDPRLAGGLANGNDHGAETIRHFNALDTVLNQSQNDNVVQRIVAKHIMSIISETDQSQWVLRSMTRGTQGWTFTYNCKDSWQMWEKEKAKNPPKTIVGEWSNKDGQDPVNMSRPAFDCRGSLTIAFSKSEKAISVKYEHTAMHQTVEQLMQLLAPPPPAEPSKAELRKAAAPTKTHKAKRQSQARVGLTADGAEEGAAGTVGTEATTPAPKKRKKAAQDGESSIQKKKTKKRKTNDVAVDPALDVMLPPEMPGALPVGDSAERPLYNTQPNHDTTGISAYPEPLIGASSTRDAASAVVSSSVHQHSILNLPPGEAERRREVAIRLLMERGIDPDTLSPEQFSILANQSPQLQQESLEMLAKYGAERLKIILPNKDTSANATASNGTPNGEEVGETQAAETPLRKGGRKKKPSLKAQAADTSLTSDASEATPRQKKPQITRGACTPCREAKLKCNKVKPTCNHCSEAGTDCVYAMQQSKKSKALQPRDDEAAIGVDLSAEPQEGNGTPDTPEAGVDNDEEPDELPSPGFAAYYPQPGHDGDHTSGVDPGDQHSYHEVQHHYQNTEVAQPEQEVQGEQGGQQSAYPEPQTGGVYRHSSGLTFPHSITPDVAQQGWTAPPGTDYDQAHTQEPTVTNVTYAQGASPIMTRASPATADDRSQSWGSVAASQRAESQAAASSAADTLTNILSGNSWSQYPTNSEVSQPTRTSPRQARRTPKPADVAAYHDGMRSASALAQAAMNSVSKSASPVAQAPLHEAAATTRAKSRQSQRAQQSQTQTRTPVPNHAAVSRQQQRAAPSVTPTPAASYPLSSDKNATVYKDTSYYGTDPSQSSHTVAYQPNYQQTPAGTTGNAYQPYEYNNRDQRSSNTMPLATATPQAATSYTSSTPSNSGQWANTASTSQARNPTSYGSTMATSTSSSLNVQHSANPGLQRSQAIHNFNVRPQAPAQQQSRSTTTTSSYGLQPQPTYNPYAPQQQQQRAVANANQDWGYMGNTSTTTYGTSSGQNTATATAQGNYTGGANPYNQQQQQQHGSQRQQPHGNHPMNLSSRTYTSMDGFNMLPGGSGH